MRFPWLVGRPGAGIHDEGLAGQAFFDERASPHGDETEKGKTGGETDKGKTGWDHPAT